jgi:predicted O-methyltransferase YrrM
MIVIAKLRKATLKCHSIKDYVNLAYSFRGGHVSIRPAQVKEEIAQLLKFLAKLRPMVVCEIGTALGGTLLLFSRVSHSNATIISIDLLGGPFGGGYPKWKTPLYNSFACLRQRIYLIRGNSHDPHTIERVESILASRKLDLLFIDGDHAYKGVKADFENYSKFVRPGGIIAFHDIAPHPPETKCEVSKFWNEIKDSYTHLEIVKDWSQNWAGIGVIYI